MQVEEEEEEDAEEAGREVCSRASKHTSIAMHVHVHVHIHIHRCSSDQLRVMVGHSGWSLVSDLRPVFRVQSGKMGSAHGGLLIFRRTF